jgi:hypothetical protein
MSGCFGRVTIPAVELKQLDGFDVHDERPTTTAPVEGVTPAKRYRLITTDGDPVDFDSTTRLTLVLGELAGDFRFRHIAVEGDVFNAVTMQGEAISQALSSIARVETDVPSLGRTIGLVLGIALGYGRGAHRRRVRHGSPMMRAIAIILIVSLSGCFNRVVIPTAELVKLDGFSTEAAKTRTFELHGTEGERVTFDAKTPLTLVTDTPKGPFHFVQLAVRGGTFEGLAVGATQLRLDLETIARAEAQVLNGDRTALAVLGLIAATALVVAGIIGVRFLVNINR